MHDGGNDLEAETASATDLYHNVINTTIINNVL